MTTIERLEAIAVYCGSSMGTNPAYVHAAVSLGRTMAARKRPLVYGGGSKGIMGVVSGAVLEEGGQVTGVVPSAMVAAGGEVEAGKPSGLYVKLSEPGREQVKTIVVSSMHERKVEMARRSCGFVGLPGGYGTFEEVFEAITWTQIGIHNKPVVLVNVLGFYDPLRALIASAISGGFIRQTHDKLVTFVDGPADRTQHETYDWGAAVVDAIDSWQPLDNGLYTWTAGHGDKPVDPLEQS
ncbi:hypothetical protein FA95DRAFT_1044313 [Auriscalpium vulgare]|uniref:Uncharacterized protein n=1 Tax=Auriscalpium vulgare TaxID=40419 RepID=A0ACB8S953_9AGAM|nr:hypothetical protein FA95DRAFT_1044313 [Auriscalpium vulgare]